MGTNGTNSGESILARLYRETVQEPLARLKAYGERQELIDRVESEKTQQDLTEALEKVAKVTRMYQALPGTEHTPKAGTGGYNQS